MKRTASTSNSPSGTCFAVRAAFAATDGAGFAAVALKAVVVEAVAVEAVVVVAVALLVAAWTLDPAAPVAVTLLVAARPHAY